MGQILANNYSFWLMISCLFIKSSALSKVLFNTAITFGGRIVYLWPEQYHCKYMLREPTIENIHDKCNVVLIIVIVINIQTRQIPITSPGLSKLHCSDLPWNIYSHFFLMYTITMKILCLDFTFTSSWTTMLWLQTFLLAYMKLLA